MRKLKDQEHSADSADLKEWVDSCVEVSNEFNISSEKVNEIFPILSLIKQILTSKNVLYF